MKTLLNIVYIDDESDLLEMFADLFSDEFTKIRTFSDPAPAIQEIASTLPDLVLIDYRLKGTTGDLVAKEIPGGITTVLITGDLKFEPSPYFFRVVHKPYISNEINELLDTVRAKKTSTL